jgi:hypothetical protein
VIQTSLGIQQGPLSKITNHWVLVAHACNPSYSGGQRSGGWLALIGGANSRNLSPDYQIPSRYKWSWTIANEINYRILNYNTL